MIDFNLEIAERVMGWNVIGVRGDTRFYSAPQQQGGVSELPDFLGTDSGHNLLLQELNARDEKVTITKNPPRGNMGWMFTARVTRRNQDFQTNQSDEKVASCIATLKAYGLPFSGDQ